MMRLMGWGWDVSKGAGKWRAVKRGSEEGKGNVGSQVGGSVRGVEGA